MYFSQKLRIAVWALSGAVGLTIMFIPIILGLYIPQGPHLIPLSPKVNNTIALGLLVAFSFPAIVEFKNLRWCRQVDRNIPRLLRDVCEAVQSGITLPRALEEASQRDYGPLSKELEHAISLFIFGASWEESLMSFAQRINRPSVLRLSTILIEAHQTGGKIVEVLNSSVDLFSNLDEYMEEQNRSMRPHIMVIYIAAVIFLIIARVLVTQFLTSISEVVKESELMFKIIDINYYSSILFWASIIESIFGGLIAGKIGEGALTAGLIHSTILLIITLITFNL